MKRHILQTYALATLDEIDQGKKWYVDAHNDCRELHPNIVTSSAMVAALSPGLRWERNIEAARRLIEGESLDGLGVRWYDGVKKAIAINDGRNPYEILGGPKVRSFWQCILNPFQNFFVCVDGHAWNIWRGSNGNLLDVPNITSKLYNRIASDYCSASRDVGLLPLQLQAITWCTYRRLNGKQLAKEN